MTRYQIGRAVESRFGGTGILRPTLQNVHSLVPKLRDAGLIRDVGMVRTLAGERTPLLAATPAGVEDWRVFLAGPITMPDGMRRALSRLYAVRPGDYPTMLSIVDRFEATLQRAIHYGVDPAEPEGFVDRLGLLWNRRDLVAQLQWCQHARDEILEAMKLR
jgi:hypothetical protein